MPLTTRTLLLAPIAIALASPSARVAADPGKPADYGVQAIHAHFYYAETGEIDERDIATGTLSLGNVLIGEGDARHPTASTMVRVELSGPTFANLGRGSVELVVKEGDKHKTILKQKVGLDRVFSEGTKVWIPFLVHQQGCDEVVLTATLIPPTKGGKKVVKTATLDFDCVE